MVTLKDILIAMYILLCFLLTAIFSAKSHTVVRQAKTAIKECERELPRNQTCTVIVTAVPQEEDKNDQ